MVEKLYCIQFVCLFDRVIHTLILTLNRRQYIKYPENPNTNVKEKIQEIAKEKEKQREQRLAYKQQLMALQASANRSNNYQEDEATETREHSSWWRRVIGMKKGPE